MQYPAWKSWSGDNEQGSSSSTSTSTGETKQEREDPAAEYLNALEKYNNSLESRSALLSGSPWPPSYEYPFSLNSSLTMSSGYETNKGWGRNGLPPDQAYIQTLMEFQLTMANDPMSYDVPQLSAMSTASGSTVGWPQDPPALVPTANDGPTSIFDCGLVDFLEDMKNPDTSPYVYNLEPDQYSNEYFSWNPEVHASSSDTKPAPDGLCSLQENPATECSVVSTRTTFSSVSMDSGYGSDRSTKSRKKRPRPSSRKRRGKKPDAPATPGSIHKTMIPPMEPDDGRVSLKARVVPARFVSTEDSPITTRGISDESRQQIWDVNYEQVSLKTATVPKDAEETGPPSETDAVSTHDSEDLPRSPSPWQAADSIEAQKAILRSIQIILDGSDIQSCHSSSDSSPWSGIAECPLSGGGASSGSNAQNRGSLSSSGDAASSANDATPSNRPQGTKRLRGSGDDSNDGDDNEPGPKRLHLETSMPVRPRFACPYQQYDRLGCPYCCLPGPRNPEGGADSFSRIK